MPELTRRGRGTLCGPVIAAAVNFRTHNLPKWCAQIRDSKKLTPLKRIELTSYIHSHADYGYGAASVTEIDRMNILHASMLAMARACHKLPTTPQAIWVDGNHLPPNLTAPAQAIIRGDHSHLSIAAASILAKTLRDALMIKISQRYPQYFWQNNKGYASKVHLQALANHGITPHHRLSFAPCKQILSNKLP